MLNSAGSDMARANRSVLIPFAPLTRRNTRPTLATRTTRSSVGDTKYLEIKSLSTRPAIIIVSGNTIIEGGREQGDPVLIVFLYSESKFMKSSMNLIIINVLNSVFRFLPPTVIKLSICLSIYNLFQTPKRISLIRYKRVLYFIRFTFLTISLNVLSLRENGTVCFLIIFLLFSRLN